MIWKPCSTSLPCSQHARSSYLEIHRFFCSSGTATPRINRRPCTNNRIVGPATKHSGNRFFHEALSLEQREREQEKRLSFQTELLSRVKTSCMYDLVLNCCGRTATTLPYTSLTSRSRIPPSNQQYSRTFKKNRRRRKQ